MKKLTIFVTILIILMFLIIIGYKIYSFTKPVQIYNPEIVNQKEYEEFKEEGIISNINYKIHNNYSQNAYFYSNRGYYIDATNQLNGPYYYLISMGEQRTGGYSIFITDLKIDSEGNVEVIVYEGKPDLGETTSMALTYPICCLELSSYANNITIKNTAGEIFIRRDLYVK